MRVWQHGVLGARTLQRSPRCPCVPAYGVNYLAQEADDVVQNVKYVTNLCGRCGVPVHRGARMPPAFREAWSAPGSRFVSFEQKDGMREVDHKWKDRLTDPEEVGTQVAGGCTEAVRELCKASAEARANELVVVALGRRTRAPRCQFGCYELTSTGVRDAIASQHCATDWQHPSQQQKLLSPLAFLCVCDLAFQGTF
jgi:hypothetical protein